MRTSTMAIVVLGLFILLGGLFFMMRPQPTTVVPTEAPVETTMIPTTEDAMTTTVSLSPVSDPAYNSTFDQTGTATLVEKDGKVVVSVSVNMPDGLTGVQPAHIHMGTCPGVGKVVYPLTNVVNGASETTLDTTLADLRAQLPLAINIHESAANTTLYTSCGNVQ